MTSEIGIPSATTYTAEVGDTVWVRDHPGVWTVEFVYKHDNTLAVVPADDATRATRPPRPTHGVLVPAADVVRPVDPTCVSQADAAALANAMHRAAREELLRALREATDRDYETQLVAVIRQALHESMPDRADTVGVLFTTTEWDNGFFFAASTAVVVDSNGDGQPYDQAVTHGEHGELPSQAEEHLTEIFGCVGRDAVAAIDLRRDTIEYRDSYYDRGDGFADLFPSAWKTPPPATGAFPCRCGDYVAVDRTDLDDHVEAMIAANDPNHHG